MNCTWKSLVLVLLLSSRPALAQELTLPRNLDQEGRARSTNLVPPSILSGFEDEEPVRVANRQDAQNWESSQDDFLLSGFDNRRSNLVNQSKDQTGLQGRTAPASQVVSSHKIAERQLSNSVETHAVPLLRIETISPPEASTFIESTIIVKVSNQGPTLAEAVELSIDVSDTVDILSTQPATAVRQKGKLFFQLGQLENGAETQVSVTIKATRAGEVKFRPRVSLAATSVTTLRAIQPELEIRMIETEEAIVGSGFSRTIQVTNSGQEAIRNLKVNLVPGGNLISNVSLNGESGLIEWLAPGESRLFELEGAAIAPGTEQLTFAVNGDNIRAEFKRELNIVRRTIKTHINGPEVAYKNSPGTFTIDVTNEAPQAANNVQVVLDIPPGMEIQVVDREAFFDNSRTKLTWNIPQLTPGETESIPFRAAIKENGTHKLKVVTVSNKKVVSNSQLDTHVIGRANLNLQVLAGGDAVETGSQTSVQIRITNTGSENANNVLLQVQIPAAIQVVPNEGYELRGGNVTVRPFNLQAGQTKTVDIKLAGQSNGEHLIRASAGSDSTSNTISAENSLFFFSGRK
ncbi:MAG TPA: CARDB domain-containing protein [Pirellulaceae bacterium]|nr:CARDB domain-containing protein [Pirellulaceae bacterium]HMO91385.1 CARDB domain-containing protein [Pirellulaceae bacterium]HMP69610.1 CARDB domain-containing protein [Pirellulaceae bacterium]